MATEGPTIHDGSQTTAAADLSAKQFFAVKMTSTSRQVNLVTTALDVVYGILQNKPKSGDAADVAIFGPVKAVAGGTIAAGAQLGVNTSGQVVTFVAASHNTQVGIALESAVVNQVFTMMLNITANYN